MCAPNDVWSLGVILVNLTCGRNPWKQASAQDSTYRAYTRSPGFLKTILPLTEELNSILSRIFNPVPELRITLSELRCRIMSCTQFTVQAAPVMPVQQQTAPQHISEYVADEDAVVDDYDDYASPLSPASTTSDGSLTSSGSTIDDFDDDDFVQDQHDVPVLLTHTSHETEDSLDYGMFQDMSPQPFVEPAVSIAVPIQVQPQLPPVACQPTPLPIQASMPAQVTCPPKSFFPLWDVVRYVQQVPIMQHPVAFQQVPFFPSFQGCY